MNLGRKKNRSTLQSFYWIRIPLTPFTLDLQSFREALTILQRQVDELDELRISHYQEIFEHEQQVWDFVQGKVSLVVRSTLDVLDRCTSKA